MSCAERAFAGGADIAVHCGSHGKLNHSDKARLSLITLTLCLSPSVSLLAVGDV